MRILAILILDVSPSVLSSSMTELRSLSANVSSDQYGVSNFDVFRWPSIKNGTQKQNLGMFIISLLFPGIPMINWGEEQAMYVLENTNANYGEKSISQCFSMVGLDANVPVNSLWKTTDVVKSSMAAPRLLQGWICEICQLPCRKRGLGMLGRQCQP